MGVTVSNDELGALYVGLLIKSGAVVHLSLIIPAYIKHLADLRAAHQHQNGLAAAVQGLR